MAWHGTRNIGCRDTARRGAACHAMTRHAMATMAWQQETEGVYNFENCKTNHMISHTLTTNAMYIRC
eukprot:3592494-Lingulodinium_polyedra.AAC.1